MKSNEPAHFSRLVLLGVVFSLGGCQTDFGRRLEGQIQRQLPASIQTEHFAVHYPPDSQASVAARRLGRVAESELSRMCLRFEVANDAHYTLFLFDDAAQIGKILGNPQVGGFSTGDFACLVYDDDAARFHELVHAVARAKIGEAKSAFLVEGLAGALLDWTQGADMHAVAKSYRSSGKLPHLAEALDLPDTAKWIAWLEKHSDLNGYNIAGSWMRFVLETYGAEKTKRYYVGQEPDVVFGRTVAQLEQEWLTALDNYVVPPAVKSRLAFTDGHTMDNRHTRVIGESFTCDIGFGAAPQSGKSLVIKFQWQKDGVDIPGATSATFALQNVSPADSGVYVLVMSQQLTDGRVLGATKGALLLTVVPP